MEAAAPPQYTPWSSHILDESERTFMRNYDKKYADYMKEGEIRVGYQLALRYFQDANPPLGALVSSLGGNEIVLFDPEPTNPLHYLFVSNCVAHQNVKNLSTTNLDPARQTLILAADGAVSSEDLQKIATFVRNGGLLISFNKAIVVVAQAFPDLVKFKNGEATLDKKIEVTVREGEDKHLFLGIENASQRGKAVRFAGIRRFDVLPNESSQVLVQETTPSNGPLVAKMKIGNGLIFHLLHVGTNEVMELRSKEKAAFYCKQVEDGPNISDVTKVAWKTAFACTQWGSFYLAISLLPFLDIIFGIINKYKRH